ncbi:hypothetical protein Ga0100231_006225 [Opitutaceae bacterium TAV4]|nr:hypothetical protein Ga0100231_006225 [Opitutaceae bacterium TAV4]RRK02607.1 hypothetical protein Ga0100230_005700 [Opitutaceae bacterium TAV3]
MTAHQADIIYTSLAFILPVVAIAVIRKGWIAIPLAAFAHWATLDAAGRILHQLDPERDSGIFAAIWAAIGWIQAIVLVTILWKVKQFFINLKNRNKIPNQSLQTTTMAVTDAEQPPRQP